ncbi:MAG: hypothetical protein LBV41_00820 [Cytophagaceae bacterium]|jgi:phosphomannomutase|nr:hypothetical protein [Cytophagaceae bacterium]
MINTDWKKLQNGSDIRGVAIDGIKGEPVNLSPEAAQQLGASFAEWLRKMYPHEPELSVSIGMDSRISGVALKNAVTNGLLQQGINVVDFGLASTPAMFMSAILGDKPMNAGVMLTASHLPFNRNGLKFFTRNGGLDKPDITAILDIAAHSSFPQRERGKQSAVDFMATYAQYFVTMVRQQVNSPSHYNTPLKGLKIVVDAGNGAGGFYATKVLEPLGADISASQFLEPDGMFPNHVPNPEDTAAMASIIEKVKESKADLGVIFDTDVDRSALVGEAGVSINRNVLIALISAVILDEHPGSTIVTDSITSNGLTWFINKHLKGRHLRFKRGYKNVINEAIRLNETGSPCWLAIETSGHAALKENRFLDDGAYLATKLIITLARLKQTGKNLVSLINELPMPHESCEYRININTPDFKSYGEKVIADLAEFVKNSKEWSIAPDNFEGIRVNCNSENQNGWFLLRLSLHDPVIPLNVESDIEGGVSSIVSELIVFFTEYDKLNTDILWT